MKTATIRVTTAQNIRITRALDLLHMEDAILHMSLAEDSVVVVTLEAHCLRAVADVVHEDDPELAKALRRLDTKLKKQAAVDWLRNKFGF